MQPQSKLLILATAAFLSTLSSAYSRGGGAQPVACAATPPSVASNAGLTKLTMCDALTDNHMIDANNTQRQGYNFYTSSPASTCKPTTPPNKISHDGTGLNLLTNGGSGGRGLTTTGPATSSPYYVGTPLVGSFYVEADMKFSPVTPSGYDGWPSIWSSATNGYISYFQHSCTAIAGAYPYIEIDMMEFMPNASIGQNGQNHKGFHYWVWNSGSPGYSCTGDQFGSDPGNPTYTNYNTFGFLYLARADNAGTGKLQWLVNNQVAMTCTYSATSAPSCSGGIAQNCSVGDLLELDTQMHDIMIAVSGNNVWPEQIRNFHIWQKP